MTGYGRGSAETPTDRFEVELRATNGKHLDVSVRLPSHLGPLEARVRAAVAARIARGRVLVAVSHRPGEGSVRVEVNAAVLKAVAGALAAAGREAGVAAALAWGDLLEIPGLLDVRFGADDAEAAWPPLRAALDGALEALEAERAREGGAVAETCRRHLAEVAAALNEARARAAEVPRRAKEAIAERIAALLPAGATDAVRLEAEAAILASRADVAEELDRVAAHLAAAEGLLGRDGAAGTELGFLAQEMLREWTTVAAKAPDAALAAASIRARTAIERIREQAANLE